MPYLFKLGLHFNIILPFTSRSPKDNPKSPTENFYPVSILKSDNFLTDLSWSTEHKALEKYVPTFRSAL
jgi:hypothetical protein